MTKIRINSLNFSDGSAVELADVTVLVGPNNSGKTRALMDIDQCLQGRPFTALVVGNLDVALPDTFEDFQVQTGIELADLLPNRSVRGLGPSLQGAHSSPSTAAPHHPWTVAQNVSASERPRSVLTFFGFAILARLSTEARLAITKTASSGNASAAPENLLQLLYRTPRGEEQLNRAFYPVFKTRLRLDWSGLSQLMLRVGQDIDKVSSIPQEALHEFKKYATLDEQGDGMRSFAAVCLAMDVAQRPITLIDEPESFLHPPQARALGRQIGANAHKRQLIVSTHSTDLLRGILSAGRDVRVIRLTRRGNSIPDVDANVPHIIDVATIRALIRDPLLSSARVLDGIFYRGVIVSEADADRAFYEMVSGQIQPDNDFHHTHAQSKSTVHRVVDAYRKIGVPCASIVDIDILNSATDLRKLLEAHGADPSTCEKVLQSRKRIEDEVCATPMGVRLGGMISELRAALERAEKDAQDPSEHAAALARTCERVREYRSPWQPIKDGGASALPNNLEAEFNQLWERCAASGLFIVPVGELEGWLRNSVPLSEGNKRNWIVAALQTLPNLEVRTEAPPWSFLANIHEYLENVPFAQAQNGALAERNRNGANQGSAPAPQ